MEYIAHAVTLAEYMRSTSRPDETYTLVADTVRHMTHFAVPKNAAPRPVEGGSLRYNGFPVGWEREWKDVWELEECVNEVLRQEKKTPRMTQSSFLHNRGGLISTTPSSSTPLISCCTGLRLDNFLISNDEASSGKTRLHVVDFHQARFLPSAFLELVLCQVVCAIYAHLLKDLSRECRRC